MLAAISASHAHVDVIRQAVGTELLRADQRAMHDQIGVAADRRSEMGIAAQIEAEVAEIFRRIFRLRLAAQHDFVDQPFDIAAFDAGEDAIEGIRVAARRLSASEISSVARNSRSALIFSGDGSSCTR